MKLEIHSQNVRSALLAYIGNTLSSSERDEFDRLVLGDENFSRQVEEIEFTLMEEYADDILPAKERAIVEGWISSSPQRREQIAITSALRETARQLAPDLVSKTLQTPKRGFWSVWFWGFAATASIVVVLAFVVLHHREPAAPVVAELSHPAPMTRQPAGEDTILLEARRLRGSGEDTTSAATYTLHPGMATRIQIVVPQASAAAVYSIVLQQASTGHTPAPIRLDGLKVSQTNSLAYVSFSLPAGSLQPGPYTGELHSTQGSYSLHFSIATADSQVR